MRKDVKAGMALALIVVVVAGWYYTRDETAQSAITLGPEPVSRPEHGVDEQTGGRSAPASREQSSRTERSPSSATRQTESPRRSSSHRGSPTDGMPLTASRVPGVSERATPQALTGPTEISPPARDEQVIEAPTLSDRVGRDVPADSAAGAVDLTAIEVYRVQPGDTLAALAEVYYGSRRHVPLILQANPQVRDPNVLRVGSEIRLPALPADVPAETVAASEPVATSTSAPATSTNSSTASARTYTVRSGDSFYAIAERVLGAGARWPELLELNRDVVHGDPQRLRPGMTLRLPPE
ncbi:MAG: LysM peptidoglycan-binding domain-containing protein [Phycisphaerales bacterium]|nr:LysM peptidoglycan-binding domain-containing protein [Phycisphaerales bacterium]